MSPKRPRQVLWDIIGRRTARDISRAADQCETLVVQFYQVNVPNHTKSSETTARKFYARDESYGRISKERFNKTRRSILAQETDSEFAERIMKMPP